MTKDHFNMSKRNHLFLMRFAVNPQNKVYKCPYFKRNTAFKLGGTKLQTKTFFSSLKISEKKNPNNFWDVHQFDCDTGMSLESVSEKPIQDICTSHGQAASHCKQHESFHRLQRGWQRLLLMVRDKLSRVLKTQRSAFLHPYRPPG